MENPTTQIQPGANQNLSVQIGSGTKLEFDFDRNDAAVRRDGQDLILTINETVELTLEGFFDNFSGEAGQPFAAVKNSLFIGQG